MNDFGTQSAIVAFGSNLFLTIYVLVKRKGWTRRLNRGFAFLSLTFTLWNLGIAIQSPLLFTLGILYVAPAVYLFLLILLHHHNPRERRLSISLWTSSTILFSAYLLSSNSVANPSTLSYSYHILSFLYISPVAIWGVFHLFSRIRLTNSRQERFRLIYVFVGMIAAGLSGVTSLLFSFRMPVYSLGAIGGIIYTICITMAIMRHRLFDFGRIAGRAIVIFVFTFVFWFLTGILGNWYVDNAYTPFLSLLIATLVLIALYEPLKALIEGQAERVLSQDSLKFQHLLQAFSTQMSALVTEQDLIRGMARTLRNSGRIKSFGIYLMDQMEKNIILREGDDIRQPIGTMITRPDSLIETIRYRQGPISQNQLVIELRSGLPATVKRRRSALYRTLIRLRASICFPFIFAEQFFGFLTLGFQDEETDVTRREEEILIAVTRQFAAALSHARLVEKQKIKDHLAALGQLASGLAHELRNPLATIRAAVQYLEPSKIDETNHEFLNIIRDEVDRLNRFVERFLSYARPVSVTGPVNMEELDKLIHRIIFMFESQPMNKAITFEVVLPDRVSELKVPGDAWNQIISNLVTNACQSLEGQGKIRIVIRYEPPYDGLELIVEDSGPGISDEEALRVMEPFYTSRPGGTGLGLAIVHQIVQNLNGEISIGKSALGGAAFSIRHSLPKNSPAKS